jgi:hypothetical protein
MSTDIDRLTSQLDTLVKRIDAELDKRVQHFSFSHDDGNGDDEVTASDPTADDGDNPGEDDYLDDDGEEDDGFDKYAREEAGGYQQGNSAADRPGSLETSDHPSSSHARHRFAALVADIKNTHGVPATQAMSLARQKDHTGYAAYNGNAAAKRAPSLLEQEMAKGVTEEVAKQRLAQLYGFAALEEANRNMSKREAVAVLAEDQLLKRAGTLLEDEPTLSRTDALRAARKAHPSLYRRMNR